MKIEFQKMQSDHDYVIVIENNNELRDLKNALIIEGVKDVILPDHIAFQNTVTTYNPALNIISTLPKQNNKIKIPFIDVTFIGQMHRDWIIPTFNQMLELAQLNITTDEINKGEYWTSTFNPANVNEVYTIDMETKKHVISPVDTGIKNKLVLLRCVRKREDGGLDWSHYITITNSYSEALSATFKLSAPVVFTQEKK